MEKKNYPNNILNPNFVEEGLLMHLDAAKATGTYGITTGINLPTMVWKDASGHGYDGTLSHFGTPKYAWNPDSLLFNGSSDFVEVAKNGIGKFDHQEFTVEVWAMPDLTNYTPLFSYDLGDAPFYCVQLRTEPTGTFVFAFNINNNEVKISTSFPSSFNPNGMNQFICTFKNGEQKLYINGEQMASGNHKGEITYYPAPVRIGKSNILPTALDGKLSHVLYYTHALNETEIDNNYIAGSGDIAKVKRETFKLPDQYINVKDHPYNAKGDGSTDDTEAIQLALNAASNYYLKEVKKQEGNNTVTYLEEIPKEAEGGGNIYIPEGTYLIDATKVLRMRSNTNLYMHGKTTLQAIKNKSEFYTVLSIRHVENVNVYGGNIRGERNEHLGTQGQWGIGVAINEACNITVEGTRADECWADGFYIGREPFPVVEPPIEQWMRKIPENIKLIDIKADHNRRQGISVISGRNIDIIRPILTNTKGFGDPEAGLDIEPNYNGDILEHIYIEDAVTKNNGGAGIMVYLVTLTGSDVPVSIEINGHYDFGSQYGILVQDNKCIIHPNGELTIDNGYWEETQYQSLRINDHLANPESYKIVVNNPYFLNGNPDCARLYIQAPHFEPNSGERVGNVTVNNPVFNDTTGKEWKPWASGTLIEPYEFIGNGAVNSQELLVYNPVYLGGYKDFIPPDYYEYYIKYH